MMHRKLIGMFCLLVFAGFGLSEAQQLPDTRVESLDWSPDGTKLVTGHDDGIVMIWDSITGEPVERFQLMNPAAPRYTLEHMRVVRWSPDGQYIAIGEGREVPFGFIVVITALDGNIIASMENQSGVPDLAWSPDGRLLTSAAPSVSQIAARDALLIWKPLTGELVRRIDVPELQGINSVAWSPDGSQIAVGGAIDDNVTIWDVTDGSKVRTLTGHTENTREVDWEEAYLVTGSTDGTVKVWNGDTGQLLWTFPIELYAVYQDINPAYDVLSVVSAEQVQTFDLQTGKELDFYDLSGSDYRDKVEWSPFGGRLALVSNPLIASERTQAENLNGFGVQFIIPVATLDQLSAVSDLCIQHTLKLLPRDSVLASVETLQVSELPDFIAGVEALPADTFPAACRADLLAVAEAVMEQP
jgi:WD40 repeat protein